MPNTLQAQISRRFKALRKKRGLSQQDLSEKLGFKDRQTISAIESGSRRIQPEELAKAAEVLGEDVDFFTDSFRLSGEGAFSFRAGEVDPSSLDSCEETAGRWIATYRTLSEGAGIPPRRLGWKLELNERSSFEDAQACGEELHRSWRLGAVPASRLSDVISRELGVLVLNVDLPEGVSGAASHLPGLQTILVNRTEPVGRRSYDLGHELFHLLTWDAMPPERVESWEARPAKGTRVEQLANNFAAALLMPRAIVEQHWEKGTTDDLHAWINATATHLRVTSVALKWRLLNIGCLKKKDLEGIHDELLTGNDGLCGQVTEPPLFSMEFVRCVHTAVEVGRLSLRKAARVLDTTPSGFSSLCLSYGLSLSYDC